MVITDIVSRSCPGGVIIVVSMLSCAERHEDASGDAAVPAVVQDEAVLDALTVRRVECVYGRGGHVSGTRVTYMDGHSTMTHLKNCGHFPRCALYCDPCMELCDLCGNEEGMEGFTRDACTVCTPLVSEYAGRSALLLALGMSPPEPGASRAGGD